VLEIARTPARLFRQMRDEDRPLEQLELVRRAYDYACALHSARFEIDGTPFHVHSVGVASIVSSLGAPASVIASATLHNAYTTGDWGDGRASGPHPARRRQMRDALGSEVEGWVAQLSDARSHQHMPRLLRGEATVDELDDEERWLVLLDLADLLDKYDDGRVAYSADGRSDRAMVEGSEDAVVALAAAAGNDQLARAFETAFARVAAEEIPDSLRLGRVYSVVVPPPSLQPRISVMVKRTARQVLGPIRQNLRRRR